MRSACVTSAGRPVTGKRRAFFPRDVRGCVLWMHGERGITLGGTPLASGTTPPAVTLTGTLTQAIGLQVEVNDVGGGTSRGQAKFRWSVDSGASYVETGVTTAATYLLGSTGITANFPVGTYAADNVYKATVAQWNDLSSSLAVASQASAAIQPVFTAKCYGAHGALTFNGTSTNLQFAANITTTAPTTVFVVANQLGDDGAYHMIFETQKLKIYNHVAWVVYMNADVTSGVTLTSAASVLEAHVRAANDVDLATNGTSVTRANGLALQASASSNIGSDTGTQQYGHTQVAEIIMYSRDISASESSMVRRYLGTKYGVTVI